jgi:hypothetical protein
MSLVASKETAHGMIGPPTVLRKCRRVIADMLAGGHPCEEFLLARHALSLVVTWRL